MDSEKTDAFFVERIKENMHFVSFHMQDISPEEFSGNELLQDSMMFRLIQISENARKLSENYRKEHGEIPWKAVFGLRNRIVHDYGNVDLGIIFETLKKDVPVLLKTIEKL